MNEFWNKLGDFLGRLLGSVIIIFTIAIIVSVGLKFLWFIWTRFLVW